MFVAVTPPPEIAAELHDLLESHKIRWPEIRWTIPAGWHFTCAFMGRVEPGQLGKLSGLLTDLAAATARFGLAITGAGAFPAPGAAKILMLPADDPLGDLEALALGCRKACRRAGIHVTDEPFQGHLTIARFAQPTDVRPQIEALAGTQVGPWVVTQLALIESLLGQGEGGRARYVVRERFPLAAH